MAIQKFALYDLIVDIIPGAILLVILYSVTPRGLYQDFFGISSSLVPGIAVILFSYPAGRIIVHGGSSVMEDRLLSFNSSLAEKYNEDLNKISLFLHREYDSTGSVEESGEDSQNGDNSSEKDEGSDDDLLKDWFEDTVTRPSEVSSAVASDVRNGLETIAGTENNPKALRRYGENVLFPRDTLYGKYEILSTFYRHISFVSILGSLIYFIYIIESKTEFLSHIAVSEPAPINSWSPELLYVPLFIALGTSAICLWRWNYWTKSRNRAFVNDLHTYLREKDLISRDEKKDEAPPKYTH